MLGTQRRLEGRIGQLLPAQQGKELPSHAMEVVPRENDRTYFRIIADALNGKCDLTDDEWRKSRRALISRPRVRLGLIPEMEVLPDGIFRCILADPPWNNQPDQICGERKERGGEAMAYSTMSVERVSAMKVAEHAADDAHLYLWTINKYLPAAYQVAKGMGI